MPKGTLVPGSKKAVSILSDWAPGAEAGKVFAQHFANGGGQILDTLKVPLANPDFARRRPPHRKPSRSASSSR